MMHSVRVFQLARDLGASSSDVIDRLKKLGVEVKTASSSIDEDTADKLKRAFKIDQLTAKKKRIYGSDEDEAEREQEKEALAARIAAEREAREEAAAAAKAAQEARKSRPKLTKAEKEAQAREAAVVEGPPPALLQAPGAPRLGKRVPLPPVPSEEEQPEEEESEQPEVEEVEAAPAPPPAPSVARPPAPPPAPVAPAVVRTTVTPRLGPVRP